jgi:molybdopterin synthase sulfur carrier subunit
MAIEVRIPTILRQYTGGAKAVEGSGATLDELFSDLDSRHPGLRDRLVDPGGLRRFVNVYLNDEDVRFLGGLETPVTDGDQVTVLPAVAGGACGPAPHEATFCQTYWHKVASCQRAPAGAGGGGR